VRSAAVVVIGTGVMHAPVLGQLLTEIIAEGATRTLDAPRSRRVRAALRLSRSAESEPNLAPTLV